MEQNKNLSLISIEPNTKSTGYLNNKGSKKLIKYFIVRKKDKMKFYLYKKNYAQVFINPI